MTPFGQTMIFFTSDFGLYQKGRYLSSSSSRPVTEFNHALWSFLFDRPVAYFAAAVTVSVSDAVLTWNYRPNSQAVSVWLSNSNEHMAN